MNWGRLFFDIDLLTGVSRRTGSFRRSPRWTGPMYVRPGRWRRHMLLLTSQLSAIVRCNAPLATGLEHALLDGPPLKVAQAMIALRDDLAAGASLGESMERCPRFYPRWYVDLIRAGETTGSLHEALKAAGDHLAQTQRFTWTVRGWTAYIVFVASVQFLTTAFLLLVAIPDFVEVLKDFGAQPPYLTMLLIRAVGHVDTIHVRYVVLFVAVFVTYKLARMLIGQRGFGWPQLLRLILAPIPFAGRPVLKSDLAHVSAVLERLLQAQVPMNEALYDCALLDIHPRVSAALHRARLRVEHGETLGQALRVETALPDSFVTLLALGEAAGRLPDAAAQLRAIYEQQVVSTIRASFDIAGPACVFCLGAITFVVYGGVFTAIIGIIDAVCNATF